MTTIRVVCTDQVLTYENTPMIASGGLEENFVQFSFCNQWDDFEKTAVFWRSEAEAYHNLLDVSNSCQLPPEVTAKDGVIYLGVFGVDADGRQRTSNVLTYRIEKGAITLETKPSEPMPDIYNQLLVKYQEMKDIAAEVKAAEEAFEEAMTQQQTAHETAVAASQASFQETVTQRQTAHEEAVDADQLAFQETMTQAQEEYEQHILDMIAAGLLPDDSITTEKLKDGVVTKDKLAEDALSAENVSIPSETAVILENPSALNVNTGFLAINEKVSPKIGDIKLTIRSDLGEKWLLCNGSCANKSSYPDLVDILTSSFDGNYIENISPSIGNVKCVTYGNGYWVVGGYSYIDSTYYARIAYATSLNGTWTVKDLWSSSGICSVNSIAYANGYWVACGQYRTSSSGNYGGRIAYSTSLGGAWSTNDLLGGNSTSYSNISLNCVAYGNGYWVTGGTAVEGYSYARIYYATSPNGSWKSKNLWSHSNSSCLDTILTCLTYADGHWVAGGLMDSGNTHSYISYATDPSGTWSVRNLGASSSSSTASTWPVVRCVTYTNGYWVFGVLGSLYYSTSITGELTTKSVFSSSDNIRGVVYANGLWMAAGTAESGNIYYSESLDGTWLSKDIWRTGSSTNGLVYVDDRWVATGGSRIAYMDGNGLLPTIEYDTVNAYIKAKE